jgi:NhaP-type Na+/H+ or K+/H+ antiporter
MDLDSNVLILLFVVLSLLFGALVKSFSKVFTFPYSVVLLLAGLCLGLYGRTAQIETAMPALSLTLKELALMEPHLILLLFLPTIIFQSAFSMEPHLFTRMFAQIAILAVPGLLLSTALTATFVHYAIPWQWSWTVCLLFGALISATDPVAVVSLLKEVSSRKRLETLIEGESLLNDGTAIVLFTLFYGLLGAQTGAAIDINIFAISADFLSVVFFGLLIGLIVAALILFWIGRLFNQPMIEITLTISAAYLAYFIAENIFHVSGVVAVVTLGLLLASIGRTRISPEVALFLQHFWQMMAHIANTLIFILVGVIIASRIRLDITEWWVTLAILYFSIQVIRAVSVFAFMPLLKRVGVGLTPPKATVLVWGGLRGAVSLALALIVAQDTLLPKALGDQVLFLTAGIVVLTIVINSSTMSWVLRYLGLDQLPAAKQASLNKAKFTIKQRLLDNMPALQQNEFLQRANWPLLINPLKAVTLPAEEQNKDLCVAFRRRLLETERQFYWSQFNQGLLTGIATNQLVKAVQVALDGDPQIAPRNSLFALWKTPRYLIWFEHIPYLNRFLVHLSFERLALSYDTARGFIQAQEEIQTFAESLSPSKQDTEMVKAEIKQNKTQTRLHINQLRENFPDLSYSLETHSAHRLLLHLERVYLQELITEGVLDESEANKLTKVVELKLANLKPIPYRVSGQSISKHLASMPWAKDLKTNSLYLLGKLAKRQIYSESELIYRQNGHASSLAVIIHGKVELLSASAEQVVETGAMIALDAFLSGRFTHNAKALTPVELVWFDIDSLKKISAKDELLAAQLADQLKH